jgi:hypothetical protein
MQKRKKRNTTVIKEKEHHNQNGGIDPGTGNTLSTAIPCRAEAKRRNENYFHVSKLGHDRSGLETNERQSKKHVL